MLNNSQDDTSYNTTLVALTQIKLFLILSKVSNNVTLICQIIQIL
jgi:hypothetical protein